jgi:hypothetical protein
LQSATEEGEDTFVQYLCEFYSDISFRAAFKTALALAGLDNKVTPHTPATWLMQTGVDKWDAAGYLGMLDRVYGHESNTNYSTGVEHSKSRHKVLKWPPHIDVNIHCSWYAQTKFGALILVMRSRSLFVDLFDLVCQ